MSWALNTDDDPLLMCDNCGRASLFARDRVEGLSKARAKGWHCFEGRSMTGAWMEGHLCRQCTGNGARIPALPNLEGQQQLF